MPDVRGLSDEALLQLLPGARLSEAEWEAIEAGRPLPAPEPDVRAQAHYTTQAIQPVEYIVAAGLDFLAGNVIKYVSRFRHKNGLEDLLKARVYLDWLIERERTGTITVARAPLVPPAPPPT